MDNQNNLQEWNIRPEQRGGGDGSKWNYALLVPLLGLAAFRWIWSRESQKEVQEVKVQYDQNMAAVRAELEKKYRATLRETRKETVQLELELEREKNRAQGYRQAMASQNQQLRETRQRLREDREALTQERSHLQRAGAAGAALHAALQREEDSRWHWEAQTALEELEEGLVARQEAFCSLLVPRQKRLEKEKEIVDRVERERGVLAGLDMEAGLRDIFKKDRFCAPVLNLDRRKNGSLMWAYLRFWRLQVGLEKHRRAEEVLLGPTPPGRT
ncbi:coiled-coil domain-containing protein 127-like [Osmerus mordax]|uniref:coiled-coil domain-containing protein 127-like n=1 Tax=Osmerus mordax TaxID=8014 RepID=UPI00350FC3FF